MKKAIVLILVAIMVLSFAACNKDEVDNTPTHAPVNKEELKQGWQEGVLTFANGKTATLPCSIDEIVKVSDFSVPGLETMKNTELKPGATKTLSLTDTDAIISIKCKNTTKEPVNIADATVVGYTINRTKDGNSQLKFANTLTVNASKEDVEDVLGVDEKAAERKFSKYEGKNAKNEKVEMRVTYDSDNLVNSVAFEIK